MKHKNLVLSLLSVAALAVACKPSEEKSTQQQFEKVQAKTEDAAHDMKDYSYAQKDKFVETTQGQLSEINRDLDALAAKIEKSSDAAKAEAKPKLQALREKTARLNEQLEKAKGASESTWNDAKAGFTKGYAELKVSFHQARQWVSDKIAP